MLFFAGDYDITLTARIWPRIKECVNPVTDPVRADELNDKSTQLELMSTCDGFNVPRSSVVSSVAQLERELPKLSFPVIARPVEPVKRGRFPGKFLVFPNIGSAIRSLTSVLEGEGADILLQEYVPGGSECLYVALACCDGLGRPVEMMLGRKLYEYPDGLMCIGETVEEPELGRVAGQAFRALGLGGVLALEFKRDEQTGRYWFIEANLRPGNFLALAEGAGLNLSFVAYQQAIGQKPLSIARDRPHRTLWRDASLVLLSRLQRRYPGQKLQALLRAGRHARTVDAYFRLADPFPALAWYLVKIWRLSRKPGSS